MIKMLVKAATEKEAERAMSFQEFKYKKELLPKKNYSCLWKRSKIVVFVQS